MTTRPPYEDAIDISYRRTRQGYERLRSAEVKPHRRYELKLLAAGAPITYHGHARADARPEPPEMTEARMMAQSGVKPVWTMYRSYKDIDASANVSTKFAGVK